MEEGLKNLPSNVSSNTEKQEEKLDDTTQQNVDNNDVTKNLTNDVTFMDLILDVRRIVFNNLDLGGQYNLSLIWKDMAGDFWRNVDVNKKWKRIYIYRNRIDKLVDLEYAGVLASAGYITHVDESGRAYGRLPFESPCFSQEAQVCKSVKLKKNQQGSLAC